MRRVVGVGEADPFRAEFAGGGGGAARGPEDQYGCRQGGSGPAHDGSGLKPCHANRYDPVQRNDFAISSSWTMYSYLSRPGA